MTPLERIRTVLRHRQPDRVPRMVNFYPTRFGPHPGKSRDAKFETDIRFVKVGQRATVRSPAFENDLPGRVKSIRQKVQKQDEIGTDPAARKDARIVEVVIELDDSRPASQLTNLQVDILIRL